MANAKKIVRNKPFQVYNMIFYKPAILLFLMAFCTLNVQAQIVHQIISGEKPAYSAGDEFIIQFQLTVDPKSCQDGMAKTGIYASGMEISSRSDWQELRKGRWQIILKCRMNGNKKGFGQLTVVRKTDKQDLFKQVRFNIKKNVDFANE